MPIPSLVAETGTLAAGVVTVSGAVTGYRTFAAALTNGDSVDVVLRDSDGEQASYPGTAWDETAGTLTLGAVDVASGTINTSGDVTVWAASAQEYPVDVRVFGFLPGTPEVTISFNPANYTLTLTPVGTTWSYYRNGIKRTITGAKTVTLSGTPPATDTYYIYIDDDIGTLTASTTVWTLGPTDTKVFVAELEWNDALTPK